MNFEQRILVDAEEAASKVAGGFVSVVVEPHGFRITATVPQLTRIVAKLGYTYSSRMWHAVDEGNGLESIVLAKYKMHALIERANKAVA